MTVQQSQTYPTSAQHPRSTQNRFSVQHPLTTPHPLSAQNPHSIQHPHLPHKKRIIALVDLDAFFCACEEKRNPTLRGKPVVVGALPQQGRGVVATANYAARKFGVRSALPISTAYERCPHAVFLQPDFSLYRLESDNVMSVLQRYATDFLQ